MRVGPNVAFLLLIAGLLAIYCEFLRPGRLVPGLLGLVMGSTGAYWLFWNSPTRAGGLLIILALLLLMAETAWDAYCIPGVLGTISLAAGFTLLFQPPRRIAPALSVPVSIIFGAITTFLASQARRARRNKWSDL
jgi:membrane-bound serine protease (ClpP class)